MSVVVRDPATALPWVAALRAIGLATTVHAPGPGLALSLLRHDPDVILAVLDADGGDDAALQGALLAYLPETSKRPRVVLLAAGATEADSARAVRLGARALLPRSTRIDEVAQCCRRLARSALDASHEGETTTRALRHPALPVNA